MAVGSTVDSASDAVLCSVLLYELMQNRGFCAAGRARVGGEARRESCEAKIQSVMTGTGASNWSKNKGETGVGLTASHN